MALILSPAKQANFYEILFGETHAVTLLVKSLIQKGVKFETGLYTLKAIFPNGKVSQQELTLGPTALMKAGKSDATVHQNKNAILQWLVKLQQEESVTTLFQKKSDSVGVASFTPPVFTKPLAQINKPYDSTPIGVSENEPETNGSEAVYSLVIEPFSTPGKKIYLIKAIKLITGWALKAAKETADIIYDEQKPFLILTGSGMALAQASNHLKSIDAPFHFTNEEGLNIGTTIPVIQPYPMPTVIPFEWLNLNEVVELRHATALGQAVHGTGLGSVYRTVAIGYNVRLAARVKKSGDISLRAEWKDTPVVEEEVLKLSAMGMTKKMASYGPYLSMHLMAQGVDPAKVLGGFIIGCGVEWTQVYISAPLLLNATLEA